MRCTGDMNSMYRNGCLSLLLFAGVVLSTGTIGCEGTPSGGADTGSTEMDAAPEDSEGSEDDSGPSDCAQRADGACGCAFQDTTEGVCGQAAVDPELGTCTAPPDYESSETSCSDGLDNDCDGTVDCRDGDCTGNSCGLGEGTAVCIRRTCVELVCFDGADNDQDGSTDCGDTDCVGETCIEGKRYECPSPENYEPDGEKSCGDRVDNDCDGATDESCGCTFDPNETDREDTDGSHDAGVCTDQVRNDDGKCPRPGEFEFRERSCGDGIDNDCDGVVDCEDTNCVTQACGEGQGGAICTGSACREIRCYDGVDNDQDGSTDCKDADGDCVGRRCEKTSPRGCPAPQNAGVDDGSTNCDGIDNDCDGETDKGCVCAYDPNEPKNTDTDGDFSYGVCKNQTKDADAVCQKPSDFVRRSASEPCDSKDHDCDGVTDEGCPCDYMGTTTGVCSEGTVDSSGNCSPPSTYDSPDEASCDDLDNDCDGTTDEGCDDDGDGYCDDNLSCSTAAACSCGDCYDENADASPLQTSFFGSDRGDGSFDYNCDGNLTKRWTSQYTGNCPDTRRSDCNDSSKEGWDGSVPSCGSSSYWKDCYWDYIDGSNPCKDGGSTRTQECK